MPGGTNSPDGKPAREGEGSSREQAGTCRAARRYPQAFHGLGPPAAAASASVGLHGEGHGALTVWWRRGRGLLSCEEHTLALLREGSCVWGPVRLNQLGPHTQVPLPLHKLTPS